MQKPVKYQILVLTNLCLRGLITVTLIIGPKNTLCLHTDGKIAKYVSFE